MPLLTATNASAGWRGGYFSSAKTDIIDVRPATITEGAVSLGLTTLAGQILFASRDRKSPMVNQSQVDCQGYKTANGLVWVIDSLFLPQF